MPVRGRFARPFCRPFPPRGSRVRVAVGGSFADPRALAAREAERDEAVSSHTVENYAKTIFQLCAARNGQPALTGQLAAALGVSPGTVTSMLKTLGDTGLANYVPYEGVELTDSGRKLALRILRRHRLIELFLVRTLQLTWDEVHDEAENMEHAVSDLLVDRIDEYLGRPEADPHGDPIPRADLTMSVSPSTRLDGWPVGEPFELVRVTDQSPEFLRYLVEVGLPLGARGRVVTNRVEAGTITLETAGGTPTLASSAAQKLLVAEPKV